MREDKRPPIIQLILEQVDQETQSEWRQPRELNVFRGSEVGDCKRAIQYAVQGYKPALPHPELALLFRDGHLHHDAIRALLGKVGRLTNTEQKGQLDCQVQVKGVLVKFRLTGTMDLLFNQEFIIDIKSINTFSFKWLNENYLKTKLRNYYLQLQGYFKIFGKHRGAILFKDKNNSALKIVWVEEDEQAWEELLKKLGFIAYANMKNARIARPFTISSKECKRCFMREHCWGRLPERKPWRTTPG